MSVYLRAKQHNAAVCHMGFLDFSCIQSAELCTKVYKVSWFHKLQEQCALKDLQLWE